jgi:hypothetical protein
MLCIEELGACNAALRRRLAAGETRLLARLASTSLDDVLPYSNDCELDQFDVPTQNSTMVAYVCWYDDGQMLLLNRSGRAETADVFSAVAGDPDFQTLIRRQMQD